MSKKPTLYLAQLLDSAEAVAKYTGGDPQTYRGSRLIRDAVHRNLEIIGEAAKRCPEAIWFEAALDRVPDVPPLPGDERP